jgi:hypothetical protein
MPPASLSLQKRLQFDFDSLALKVGPAKLGPFKISTGSDEKKKPFFVFFYADDDIICAQGRGVPRSPSPLRFTCHTRSSGLGKAAWQLLCMGVAISVCM